MPGGKIDGRTDCHAARVEKHPVSPADLTATILDTLGVDPRSEIRDARGVARPISAGRVLERLWG